MRELSKTLGIAEDAQISEVARTIMAGHGWGKGELQASFDCFTQLQMEVLAAQEERLVSALSGAEPLTPHGRHVLLADRAYDSDALRADMAARGAWANVRPMPNRKQRFAFSPFLYRYRNRVERFFNKPKHFRAIATRFEKHADN
jgi:transposase